MPQEELKEDSIGLGGRIFNILNRLLYGRRPVQRISLPGRKERLPRVFAGHGLTTDDFETWYGFYSDRMRIGKKRTEIYEEVDSMDGDDLPAATLDLYAEDATQTDVTTGKKVWAEDCSDDIREIIENLFERLRREERDESIVRAMAKYGDVPVELWWEPGEGITYWRAYHPKFFKRFEEKGTGMLLGFYLGPDMENAQSVNAEPFEVIHFRVMGSLSQMYGTSLLATARRAFRRLRMAEDAAIMYRLQRHADRDVYHIDVTGMGDSEAAEYMRRFAEGIKKTKFFDERTGDFRTDFNPWTANDDIFIPVIQGRETKLERLSGNTRASEVTDLEYFLSRYHAAVRIPPAVFGYNVQGSTPYDTKTALSAQDARYARIPAKLQRYYLLGLSRLVMLHLAFLGLDPYDEKNKFTLCMTPVSYLEEVHRQQLVEIRVDILDRLLKLGEQVQFNKVLWHRYILKEYAKLSDSLLNKLLPEEYEEGAVVSGGGLPPVSAEPFTPPPAPGAEPTPAETEPVLPPPPPPPTPEGGRGAEETPPVPENIKGEVNRLLEMAAETLLEEKIKTSSRMPSSLAQSLLSKEGAMPKAGAASRFRRGNIPE